MASSTLDLDIPSVLVGVGAGLVGWDFAATSVFAGVSILIVGAVPLVVGLLQHKQREATS